jgi:lysophospholipase L1-like esterase
MVKSPRKWRTVGAAALVAVAVPALLSSGSSSAQEDQADHADSPSWVGSWAAAVTAGETTGRSHNGFNNESIREIVHLSVGGDKVRIRFSNIWGTQSVTIGHATAAKPNTASPTLNDVDPGSVRQLTFNGHPSATMLKGQELLSDPIPNFRAADMSDVVISIFLPTGTGPVTWHATSQQSSWSGTGDLVGDNAGTGYTIQRDCCWYFLSGVDVLRDKAAGSVVVIADSIGDGNGSTLNGNARWPDFLAKRMLDLRRNGKVPGVLNASLAGNRLLHEGEEPGAGGFPGFFQLGTNAGARLNEDVFEQTGVHTVLFDLAINDIWMKGDSADAIIEQIRSAGAQVKERGLRFVVATLGPYEGFDIDGVNDPTDPNNEWTPGKDATRNAVNAFLRNSHEFDGVIDFDALLRDPAHPSKLKAEFDSGDHIHPNDAGDQAMAGIIPLNLVLP